VRRISKCSSNYIIKLLPDLLNISLKPFHCILNSRRVIGLASEKWFGFWPTLYVDQTKLKRRVCQNRCSVISMTWAMNYCFGPLYMWSNWTMTFATKNTPTSRLSKTFWTWVKGPSGSEGEILEYSVQCEMPEHRQKWHSLAGEPFDNRQRQAVFLRQLPAADLPFHGN